MSSVPSTFVVAVLAGGGATGCATKVDDTASAATECDVRKTAVELAGPGAFDCGEANGKDTPSVWQCAVDGFEADHAFYLFYDDHGVDSVWTVAWASDGGRIWVLSQVEKGEDPGPFGIEGNECMKPSVGTRDVNEYYPDELHGYPALECEYYAPDGNHYQVCGPICDGNPCSPEPLPFDP
jgi:hypothetical protein